MDFWATILQRSGYAFAGAVATTNLFRSFQAPLPCPGRPSVLWPDAMGRPPAVRANASASRARTPSPTLSTSSAARRLCEGVVRREASDTVLHAVAAFLAATAALLAAANELPPPLSRKSRRERPRRRGRRPLRRCAAHAVREQAVVTIQHCELLEDALQAVAGEALWEVYAVDPPGGGLAGIASRSQGGPHAHVAEEWVEMHGVRTADSAAEGIPPDQQRLPVGKQLKEDDAAVYKEYKEDTPPDQQWGQAQARADFPPDQDNAADTGASVFGNGAAGAKDQEGVPPDQQLAADESVVMGQQWADIEDDEAPCEQGHVVGSTMQQVEDQVGHVEHVDVRAVQNTGPRQEAVGALAVLSTEQVLGQVEATSSLGVRVVQKEVHKEDGPQQAGVLLQEQVVSVHEYDQGVPVVKAEYADVWALFRAAERAVRDSDNRGNVAYSFG